MNQDALERILQCSSLPSLPAVAVRILELTSDLNVSIPELTRTIEFDQGLAAKVLRTVNSSFYGLRKPCSTINQAVVVLGLAAVKSLSLSFSLVSTIKSASTDCDVYTAYWRRALYTAIAAKAIARAARLKVEDEAFLGGLLQDIGMVAMHVAFGDEYLAILNEAAGDHSRLAQLELDTLEAQHPDIGAMLAQRWRLPPDLITPIKYHELPVAAPRDHAALVRCVALGNTAHDCLTDKDPAPALERFQAHAMEWFALAPATTDDLLRQIADGAREVGPLFSLNTGPYPDADAILAGATARRTQLESQQPPREGPLTRLLSDSDEYDPLTGALGPGAFNTIAQEAFRTARTTHAHVSFLNVTLDHFDRLSAAGGREAADAALVETAALLDAHIRPRGGTVARLDHASFAIILPGLDRAACSKLAADLRATLEAQSPAWKLPNLRPLPITASFGIAAMSPTDTIPFNRSHQLFIAARRATEAAVRSGGNCVRAFQPKIAA